MLTIYKASAGSGKTYTLAKEYITLLLNNKLPRAHRRILAVTFTHKATNEMKTRILNELNALATHQKSDYRKELTELRNCSEAEIDHTAGEVLIDILQDYSAFSISTIDSFFQQIMRAFAREINVSGSYSIELETDEMLTQAIDNMFFELDKPDNKDLLNWITHFAENKISEGKAWNPRKDIELLGAELFKENYQNKLLEANKKLHDKKFLANYRKDLKQIIEQFAKTTTAIIDNALSIMQEYGLEHSDFSHKRTSKLEKIKDGDYNLGSRLTEMLEDVSKAYTKTSSKKAQIEDAYHNGLRTALQNLDTHIKDNLLLSNSAKIVLQNINLLGILSDVSTHVARISEEQNLMPISDTNMLLSKIIDGSDAPFVYEKIGSNIQHFMIDEFQDTSTMQWHNFQPLISNSVALGNNNLVVGDVKQSIYRWRNSDWSLLDHKVLSDSTLLPQENVLGTNWRSSKNIVEFNNSFFTNASKKVSGLLQESGERIAHAYSHLKQKVHRKNEGYVQVEFIDKKEYPEWKEQAMQLLLSEIQEIEAKKIPLHEVAILTRKKADAQLITEFLISHNYRVVSNEGLKVSTASAIRFLIGMLHIYANAENEIQRLIVNFEYACHCLKLTESEALEKASATTQLLFNEKEMVQVEKNRYSALFDKMEQLIALFDIYNWGEDTFVQAFLDIVFSYTENKIGDINNFLEWWDKKGCSQTIATPNVPEAIQIMTIHKSKGLEFNIVFIPFCDWQLDLKSNILWTKPLEHPFNALELVPIVYNDSLLNSIFKEEYINEKMQAYIDHLNLLYVAFTRPKNELFCYCPLPENVEIKDMPSLIWNCINENLNGQHQSILGDKNTRETTTQKTQANTNTDSAIQPSIANRLRPILPTVNYIHQGADIQTSRLNLGIIMHEILCLIEKKSDQEHAIEKFILSGKLNLEQAIFIRQELEKFWQIKEVDTWFSDKYKVLNEAAILTPTGENYRPDRLMLDNEGQAIIVDYKFGSKEQASYLKQVQKYMSLVTQMGYKTKGYLCYVELNKVVSV